MNHLLKCFFLVSILFYVSGSDSIKMGISSPKQGRYYQLNEAVNITCEIPADGRKLFVAHGSFQNYKSEGMHPYEPIYKISKEKVGANLKFTFHIVHLTWAENGTWFCTVNDKYKSRTVGIRVFGELERLEVVLVDQKSQEAPKLLLGQGRRTNPFDLHEGRVVNISCRSSCSSFPVKYSWTYVNISEPAVTRQWTSPLVHSSQYACKSEGGSHFQANSSISWLIVKCDGNPGLVGSNQVTCMSTEDLGDGQVRTQKREVYVLCPGGYKSLGSAGSVLTNWEIVGISVSILITIFMLVGLSFSARNLVRKMRNEKYYGSQQMRAIRV